LTQRLTGSDLIGRTLKNAGITHAFGIPAGEVLALIQGLNAADIQFILVKHENNGGFFAEGHWHMTGALPVLVATLGPGVANAINVVCTARQCRRYGRLGRASHSFKPDVAVRRAANASAVLRFLHHGLRLATG
jgi:sulfopyruvate decarboxylase TPP-binding subunit